MKAEIEQQRKARKAQKRRKQIVIPSKAMTYSAEHFEQIPSLVKLTQSAKVQPAKVRDLDLESP